MLKARLSLETCEAREVPANLGYTNMSGDGQFDNAANWRDLDTNSTSAAPPMLGDSLTFDGTLDPLSNTNLVNLHGFGLPDPIADFASIQLINGYAGTVTLVPDGSGGITTGAFTLSAAPVGAIAQPFAGTDLSVLGAFNWTGGILNSTPSDANVNILGGGAISPPLNGALDAGSRLVFGSSDGIEKTTFVGEGGNVVFTSPEDVAMRVGQKAKVAVKVRQGNDDEGFKCLQASKNKVLELTGGELGYYGEGTRTDELRVVNTGGTFYVGDETSKNINIKLTHGDANKFLYTQSGGQDTKFRIFSSCTLDATACKGVEIAGGLVTIVANYLLPGLNDQVATVKGDYTMSGGSIGFAAPTGRPKVFSIATGGLINTWFTFKVDGDVTWSGGSFVPGVDASGGNAGNVGKEGNADKWVITKKLTVSNPNADAAKNPRILPEAEGTPAGQQAKGTWNSIKWDTLGLLAPDPAVGNGFTIDKDAPNKFFNVKK